MPGPVGPARIIAKMNSLVDPDLIDELYRANAAGVQIDLIIRGICCLRPGVPGLSERIRAVSIIDRYLEHARVFYFQNGSEPDYLLASADWMPRNLDHRVEVAFPVIEPDAPAADPRHPGDPARRHRQGAAASGPTAARSASPPAACPRSAPRSSSTS